MPIGVLAGFVAELVVLVALPEVLVALGVALLAVFVAADAEVVLGVVGLFVFTLEATPDEGTFFVVDAGVVGFLLAVEVAELLVLFAVFDTLPVPHQYNSLRRACWIWPADGLTNAFVESATLRLQLIQCRHCRG